MYFTQTSLDKKPELYNSCIPNSLHLLTTHLGSTLDSGSLGDGTSHDVSGDLFFRIKSLGFDRARFYTPSSRQLLRVIHPTGHVLDFTMSRLTTILDFIFLWEIAMTQSAGVVMYMRTGTYPCDLPRASQVGLNSSRYSSGTISGIPKA
jgi:hypothetical protein